MPGVNDQISHILDEFGAAWQLGGPPAVGDYLGRVDASARARLLTALIEADIGHRLAGGSSISAEDYREFGSKAEETARRLLDQAEVLAEPPPRECCDNTQSETSIQRDGLQHPTIINDVESHKHSTLQPQIDRFREAWDLGIAPRIEKYVPSDCDENRQQEVLIELVRVDMEYRWRGQPELQVWASTRALPALPGRPCLDDYTERFPSLGPASQLPDDLILHEYRLRCELGEPPEDSEYESRFGSRFHQLLPALQSINPPTDKVHQQLLPTTKSIPRQVSDGLKQQDAPQPTPAVQGNRKAVDWEEFPRIFGRYEILRELGQGGMGTVFLAKDTKLDRMVALKVPSLPADEHLLQRFYREAQSVSGLRHVGICPVYDVGEIDGIHHIAMAYIEGQTLSNFHQSKKLTSEDVSDLICKIGEALSAAHRQGVIHRDLKPSNIMIQHDGRPVIMDFGLARRIDRIDTQLTSTGAIVGTPAFMAPEQVRAEVDMIGPATDVYALGVIMYQLLTNRLPYTGDLSAVMNQILHHVPAPPSRHSPGIDTRLDVICMKAMSKRVEDRYQRMDDLSQAITAFLRQPSPNHWTQVTAKEAEIVVEVIGILDRFGWARGIGQIRDLATDAGCSQRGQIIDMLLDWFRDSKIVPRDQAKRWESLELNPWRFIGLAFEALHKRQFHKVELLLRRAEEFQTNGDTLAATIDHCYGVLFNHRGELRSSVTRLHRALERCGRGHFLEGRILDSLGKAYAAMNHFTAAREFYEHAIQAKHAWNDEQGLAVTHGQLGRLFLDWRDLDLAEQHFRIDLDLAERREDLRAMCLMFNHLGRVYLQRQLPDEALGYFDESLHLAIENGYSIEEGFTRKDIALARLKTGDVIEADEQLEQSRRIFSQRQFQEGSAHVQWGRALAAAEHGEHRRAERMLRESIAHFEGAEEISLAAECWLDMAAVREARHASRRLVADALLKALERAEQSRREWLIEQVERELQRVAPAEHLRHAQRQSAGCDLAGLINATAPAESSVMSLEILNPTSLIRSDGSRTGISALNQLFFEITPVFQRYGVTPYQYRFDGFEAICGGARHARRAVMCGLHLLLTLAEINRPRRVLELPEVHVSIRVSSGRIIIGKVGTYRKLDFVATGMATKLASRIPAVPDVVTVSEETHRLTQQHFSFDASSPRMIELPELGRQQYWIVENSNERLDLNTRISIGDESTI